MYIYYYKIIYRKSSCVFYYPQGTPLGRFWPHLFQLKDAPVLDELEPLLPLPHVGPVHRPQDAGEALPLVGEVPPGAGRDV